MSELKTKIIKWPKYELTHSHQMANGEWIYRFEMVGWNEKIFYYRDQQ